MGAALRGEEAESNAADVNARWYTVEDVLAKLQALFGHEVSEMVVYRLIGARRFPGVKFGRRIYLRPDAFDQFLIDAATTDTLLDLATWEPKTAAPTSGILPPESGPRSVGEDVA